MPQNMFPFTNADIWPNMGLIVIAGSSGTMRANAAFASSLGLGIFMPLGAAMAAFSSINPGARVRFPANAGARGFPRRKLHVAAGSRGITRLSLRAEMKDRARQVFDIGIYVVVAATVLQFFLAGLGIFVDASLFYWHTSINPFLVGVLPLSLALVGWYAGLNRLTLWLTAYMFGLVAVQSLLLSPFHIAAHGTLTRLSALHAP